MKRCTKCKVEKDLEKFYKGNGKFGRSNWCKGCCKKYKQKYFQNNKEKLTKQKREYCQTEQGKLVHNKASKKYRQENKEKILEYQKKYCQKNKEYYKKYNKKYHKNNKEKIKIRQQKYYQNNKEKIKIKNRKYFQTEQGKLVRHKIKSKRRSLLKKNLNTLTLQDWNQILKSQNNKCAMCGKSFKKVRATKDHILPLSKGGQTTKENIQALCQSCNSKKGAKLNVLF